MGMGRDTRTNLAAYHYLSMTWQTQDQDSREWDDFIQDQKHELIKIQR